jgi:hypothetical protein
MLRAERMPLTRTKLLRLVVMLSGMLTHSIALLAFRLADDIIRAAGAVAVTIPTCCKYMTFRDGSYHTDQFNRYIFLKLVTPNWQFTTAYHV